MQYDLNERGYTAAMVTLGNNGFQPISIASYEQNGEPRYAGVWERRPQGNPWQQRHNISAEEFQDQFEALLGVGYRPISVGVTTIGGQLRYTGIFEKKGGDNWAMRPNLSVEEFRQAQEQYARLGMQPVGLTGTQMAGETRFAAVWETRPQPSAVRFDVPMADYPKVSQALGKEGLRPQGMVGYVTNGQPKFAVLFHKQPGPAPVVEVQPSLAPADLVKEHDKLTKEGYIPVTINGYSFQNKPRFAVVWEKLPIETPAAKPPAKSALKPTAPPR